MRLNIGMSWIVALGLLASIPACAPKPSAYAGPGCLLYLYPLPRLGGTPLPIRGDSGDITSAWHETAASARVVYGTWRLYSEADFVGFAGDYKAPQDVEFGRPIKIGSLTCVEVEASDR